MPTGYTDPVRSGKITTLDEFALNCARAFGALVMLRDEPDAPIPEVFEPSDYHARQLETAKKTLARLHTLSPIEAQREMQQEYSQKRANWRESNLRDVQTAVRYRDMLARVIAWTPPSKDHENFHGFMKQQLVDSLKWDCHYEYNQMPRLKRWPDWLRDKIAETNDDIVYAETELRKEIERCNGRTLWVQMLRASLPATMENDNALQQ